MKIRQESITTQLYITNKLVPPQQVILGIDVPVQFHDTISPISQSKPESSWGPYDKYKAVFPNCVLIANLTMSGMERNGNISLAAIPIFWEVQKVWMHREWTEWEPSAKCQFWPGYIWDYDFWQSILPFTIRIFTFLVAELTDWPVSTSRNRVLRRAQYREST